MHSENELLQRIKHLEALVDDAACVMALLRKDNDSKAAQISALVAEKAVILQDRAQILKELDDTCAEIGMRIGEKAEDYPCPTVVNTDAAIAALRAEGIEQWIASRNGAWNGTTKQAEEFARQLRESKGAQK